MRVIPNEAADFAYPVHAFTVGRSGMVRARLTDGSELVLAVRAGDTVRQPVRRLYQVGTTAGEFQTPPTGPRRSADYFSAVPYAPPAVAAILTALLLDQGGGAVLTDAGDWIRV